MKIFLFTSVPLAPPWDQGDKNFAYALSQGMPRQRFEILTSSSNPVPFQENVIAHPVYWSNRPSTLQKFWVLLWLFYRSMGSNQNSKTANDLPDLYHFIYRPTKLSSRFLRSIPQFRQRPKLHTIPANTNDQQLSANLIYSDKVVTLSEFARKSLEKKGIQNVIHIPQGIDLTLWEHLASKKDTLKARQGLTGKRVLLYPGHYSPGYGIRNLMKALPQIVSQVPDVVAIFACRIRHPKDINFEAGIRNDLEEMGLSHVVRIHRTVEDMQSLVGASDLVVFPFRTMVDKVDIPTTIIESMAAGVPVVISDIPPMKEIFCLKSKDDTEPAVGFSVPPDDPKALAEAVVTLLNDETLCKRIGKSGQMVAKAHFDIQKVALRYEQLYHELV